jgi:hypothetical protein
VPARAANRLIVYSQNRSFTSLVLSIAFYCGFNYHSVGLEVDFYAPEILLRIERLSLLKIIASIADGRWRKVSR